MQTCRFMLLLHQRENNKWKKIRTPVFQHYLMMPKLIPFIKSTFKKSFCQLETNPICPVKGALLQFHAWHEAAGGGKNPSSQTVKRRPHAGVWTCLAELREPAGVGVSTAALQIKQRAAHDSSGWMPWNTARRASRSIHCVWHWKRYPEPQPRLCLFPWSYCPFTLPVYINTFIFTCAPSLRFPLILHTEASLAQQVMWLAILLFPLSQRPQECFTGSKRSTPPSEGQLSRHASTGDLLVLLTAKKI